MIEWVAELSVEAVGKDNVYIATENKKISDIVSKKGFNSILTSENCLTGTDRVAEVAQKIDADIYVNVQGDEPLVKPNDIKKIISAKKKYPGEIINGYTSINKEEDPNNVNIPKVIFSNNNHLIYISRKAIPGFKEESKIPNVYFKQVCIYAFNKNELLLFKNHKSKSKIEQIEDIEILRFFEFEKKIRLVETNSYSLAVDEPIDVERVEKELIKLQKNT